MTIRSRSRSRDAGGGFSGGSAARGAFGRRAKLALVSLFAIGYGGAEGRQETVDPLSSPRPFLAEPLILPIDRRPAAEKIVATMPAVLRQLEDPSSVRVIVTLHEPLSSRGVSGTARSGAGHRARIAAVEHDFVAVASRLGFRAAGALTHFAIVAGEISPDRLEYLAGLRQVRAIQPDRTLRAARVQGKALIASDDLLDDFDGDGHGITVAVVDSGIRADHPELAGKVSVQRTYVGGLGQDTFGHGTQVAGIIAGDDGLAPEAEVWDIKVIGADGTTTISTLLEALDDLIPDLGSFQILVGAFADPTFRFATACDSLDPASTAVVQEIRDGGTFMVSATGDNGDISAIGVPACLTQILATGAVYDGNVGVGDFSSGCQDATTSADKITCYSNSGVLLDFFAPADCARSPRGDGGYDDCFGGTSAATAYVAGAAAQILSLLPNTPLTALENALKSNGPLLNDTRNGISRRRINARAAYLDLAPANPPTATPTAPGPTPTKTPTGPKPTATPTKTATPGSPPGAPFDLTAQALTQSAVLLEWKDGATNEVDFRIEAMSGGGGFMEVATTGANVLYFPVEELAAATPHSFRVRARNAAGNSGYSNTAMATTAAGPVACVPNATTACLIDGQFRITGEMKNFSDPPVTFENNVMSFPGTAAASFQRAVALGRAESAQAVFFDSFTRGNFEIGVKMVNACGLPPSDPRRSFWTFFGGLTNKRTDITVTDTVTGQSVVWVNPASMFPTTEANTLAASPKALPCEDLGAPTACVRDDRTACLFDGRFKVFGSMRNAQDQEFVAQVMQFSTERAETNQAVFFDSFTPGNFEVGVKMVNGCAGFGFYWIFYGGLTSADTDILAVHVPTGRVDIWRNPPGMLPTTEGRTQAFPCS